MILRSFIVLIILAVNACAYKPEPITLAPRSEVGIASYYGSLKTKPTSKTANGEKFDPKLLTAAHQTLPFGSVVKVENLKNNKSVMVRINDRGPFVEGRIVDLSYAAANEINMLDLGMVPVRLTYLK